jgi:hypothetical protein
MTGGEPIRNAGRIHIRDFVPCPGRPTHGNNDPCAAVLHTVKPKELRKDQKSGSERRKGFGSPTM